MFVALLGAIDINSRQGEPENDTDYQLEAERRSDCQLGSSHDNFTCGWLYNSDRPLVNIIIDHVENVDIPQESNDDTARDNGAYPGHEA